MSPSTSLHLADLTALARAEFPDIDLYPGELALLSAVVESPPDGDIDGEEDDRSADSQDTMDESETEVEVRGKLIRWLCVNAQAKALIDPSGVQVYGAHITGQLNLDYVDVPFPIALIKSVLTEPASLISIRVPDLMFSGSSTCSISMDSSVVANSVYMDSGFVANGQISLHGARIGGNLQCGAGTFRNPGEVAIMADGLSVGGYVLLRAEQVGEDTILPFLAEGSVRLHSAKIGCDLDCTGGQFLNSEGANRGRSIHLGPATIKGTVFFRAGFGPQWAESPPFLSEGVIDLRGASAGSLWDDETCWPPEGLLFLDGFVYERFRVSDPMDTKITVPTDSRARLRWLRLDTTKVGTQPYRQLAKVIGERGDTDGARLVLEALEEKLARLNELSPRKWGVVPLHWFQFPGYWLRRMIGFGYRPGRAIWALLLLWLAGSVFYWRGDQARLMIPTDKDAAKSFVSGREIPANYPNFSAPIYSLENTFPLVKLGQADKWQPSQTNNKSAWLQRMIWLQNIAGWFLATLFVAGVSGIVQRD